MGETERAYEAHAKFVQLGVDRRGLVDIEARQVGLAVIVMRMDQVFVEFVAHA